MKITSAGGASYAAIDGQVQTCPPGDAFEVFHFSPWSEASGQAAVAAMVAAGNVAAGGSLSVSSAAQVLSAVDPAISHSYLAPAALAADELIAASQSGGITTAAAFGAALHFAQNAHLFSSSPLGDVVSNALAGLLR